MTKPEVLGNNRCIMISIRQPVLHDFILSISNRAPSENQRIMIPVTQLKQACAMSTLALKYENYEVDQFSAVRVR